VEGAGRQGRNRYRRPHVHAVLSPLHPGADRDWMASGTQPGIGSIGLFFVGIAVITIYQFALLAILPAVQAIFILRNRIDDCFRPSMIKRAMRPFGWSYLVAPILAYGAGFVASFGFILCFVGYFFTGFWGQAVAAQLAGQVAQPLLSDPASP
jgi:hypothetical protein